MKNRSSWAALAAGVVALVFAAAYWTASAQIPDQFKNLKVFPKDIAKKALVDEMKSYAYALGTRCWYCHEGEGDDLSTYDFASDKKEHKATARVHIEMTREINEKFFKGKEGQVTCITCHRGEAEPKD